MKNTTNNLLFLIIVMVFSVAGISAQTVPDLPQRAGTLTAAQALSFGDFTLTSAAAAGGSVIVDFFGQRSATGDVVLLNISTAAHPAIFEYKLCPGRRVTISYQNSIILNGDNGGTMKLNLGNTNKGANGSSFMSNTGCDDVHQIAIGGELIVGSLEANPAGFYSGSFSITFIQE